VALLFAAGVLSLAVPAVVGAQPAADGVDRTLAIATVYSGGVDIQPQYDYSYDRAIVTVSGGEIVVRRVFEAGEAISVEARDLEGQLLPDGVYGWELELVPDTATARELKVAATENGGLAPAAWTRQAGSFAVSGGVVASADLPELGQESSRSEASASRLSRASAASGFSRSDAIDDDHSVGFDLEAEAKAQAAASAAPVVPGGATNFERSDAGALAMGGSLERPATAIPVFPGEARPTPRSISPDGKDGRPRSRDEVR
jgi:hypothetical protein